MSGGGGRATSAGFGVSAMAGAVATGADRSPRPRTRTDDAWARRVRSAADLPAAFQELVPEDAGGMDLVHTPREGMSWSGGGEQVVCLRGDGVSILDADPSGHVVRTDIAYADMFAVEHGHILLHSWITLHHAVDGRPSERTINFNTTVDTLFMPIVDRFRHSRTGLPIDRLSSRDGKRSELAFLMKRAFKFFSFGNLAVPQDATIRGLRFCGGVTERRFRFFSRTRVAPQLVMLTDEELIRVSDQKPSKSWFHFRVEYGTVNTYIPLKSLRGASAEASDDEALLRLDFGAATIDWPFAPTAEPALREFAGQVAASAG